MLTKYQRIAKLKLIPFRKHLRLQRRHAQNSIDLYKIHERAFPEWFREMVLELRESRNLSDDFFSLAMGPFSDDDLDNIAGGSSSVGDNTGFYSQQATPTPRRCAKSRLLELERHVVINRRIPMTIASGAEKPISPHAVHFSQAIGVCVRKTFSIHCLKWADVGREYIEVVKGDLQRLGGGSCQPTKCISWTSNHGRTRLRDRSSLTIIVAGPSRFYNDTMSSLREKNQMLELQSQPTLEGSQPLFEDEICDQVLGRRPDYSKGLGWGPKPKARRTARASSSSTSCSQSTEKEIELQAKLHEALERIEVQDRNHQALASQVESMKKMIEELTRAQHGPPHDP
uniref:CACTA en-spm transposon protein n=1 Tax=Cucumis melo TaxID=3656 RepID=A0A9I9E6W7_CUCME